MVAVTCWALLLLTTLQTIAGRQLAAGPPASSMQMHSAPRMQHHVPGLPAAASRRLGRRAGALGGVVLGDGSHFKGRSPPPDDRNMVPRPSDFQQVKKRRGLDLKKDSIYGGHRLLVGSSPPTCQGKCGSCYPCSPIHISLGSPHGALTQQEYYPEVWRCKCGSRYFLP